MRNYTTWVREWKGVWPRIIMSEQSHEIRRLSRGDEVCPAPVKRFLADRYRVLLVILALVLSPLTTLRLYGSDEIQYFAYLRSLVFDGDLEFADEYEWFHDRDPAEYAGFAETFLGPHTPAGRAPNNAAIGSAILWAPFYLAVVGVESLIDGTAAVPPRGYSKTDISAICIASMFYGVLGLLLTQEILRRFASAAAAFAATLLVWLATNLAFYMYVTPPMSHANSFFVSALFLWWWLRSESGWKQSLILGLIGGLLAMVRWQDVLLVSAPLATPILSTEVTSVATFRRWLVRCMTVAAGVVIAFVPQLIVWLLLNGSLTPYGLLSVGTRFSYSAPYLWGIFFSPFHGLFLWSPVLVPAFVGLGLLAASDGRGRGIALAVAAQIYLLSGYVVAFGHSFGQRLFIGCLPAAAIGLAVFLARVGRRFPVTATGAGVFCVWWNLSLMIQHGTGMIPRNQEVDLDTLVWNQFVEVPKVVPRVLARYLFDRRSLYKLDPLRGSPDSGR